MRPEKASCVLRATKTSAFLVTNTTNIRYLTNMQLSYGVVLITPRIMTLFVDSRYCEAAEKLVYDHIRVQPITKLPKACAKLQQCGFEADTMTVAQLQQWKKKNTHIQFVPKQGTIEEFRRTKDADEIRLFRKAQRITQKILAAVPSFLQIGRTEIQVAEDLRQCAMQLGADGLSFDPIVAFQKHSSRPHHHPSSKKLRRADMVQIDVGARYHGYCADQSRVFFTGTQTALQQKVYTAVAEAKAAAIQLVQPGVTNHAIYAAACTVLQQHGFLQYFTHALGHGVGLDIHEGANLSSKVPERTLEVGEIVTIEPGVYLPGKFGMRLEDEIVVC